MTDDDEPTAHLDDRDGGGLASPIKLSSSEVCAILGATTTAETDKLIARARARIGARTAKRAPTPIAPTAAPTTAPTARADAKPVARRIRPIVNRVAPTPPTPLLIARASVAARFRQLDAHDLERLRASLAITGARRLDPDERHRFVRFVTDHEYSTTRLDCERFEIVAELDRLDDAAISRRLIAAVDGANADLRKKLDAAERRERLIDSIDPATHPDIARLFGKGIQ